MRLRLFTPLRAKITSSAQSLVPPSGRPSQESSLPILKSFNHLVGAGQQLVGDGQAERPGSLEIDDQLVLGRLLNGQVGRLFALENTSDVDRGLANRFRNVVSVAHKAAVLDEIPGWVIRGDRMARRERDDMIAPVDEKPTDIDQERATTPLGGGRESRIDFFDGAGMQDDELLPDASSRCLQVRHIPGRGDT